MGLKDAKKGRNAEENVQNPQTDLSKTADRQKRERQIETREESGHQMV